MTTSAIITRARITAILLIVSGLLLDADVVGWLVGPNKASVLAQTILAFQGMLLAGGFLLHRSARR